MNKNNLLFGIIGLIIGLAVGFFVANSINKNATINQTIAEIPNSQQTNPQANPPMQGQRPQGGMQADVQKTLDQAANEPDNFQAQIEAGRMYAKIQSFDKALAFFQKAQKLKPDDFAANAMLGNAHFDAKQFKDANSYYARALEIKPQDVTIQSDYATTFFKKESPDFERAIKEFEKALALDSKHEPTLYNLGLTYIVMKDSENAQKTLERLKTANPNSPLIARLEESISKK